MDLEVVMVFELGVICVWKLNFVRIAYMNTATYMNIARYMGIVAQDSLCLCLCLYVYVYI